MSVHTLMPGALKIEFPESKNWISFSSPPGLNYQGINCTATMNDGTVLQGEFDRQGKASFYSFSASFCTKFEVENLDRHENLESAAQRLLKQLKE